MNKVISKVSQKDLFDQLEVEVEKLKKLVFQTTVSYIENFDIRNPNPDSFNQILACLDNDKLDTLCKKENQSEFRQLLEKIKAIDSKLFPNRLFPYNL